MITLAEAFARVCEAAVTLPAEEVSLDEARGRVVQRAVVADLDSPPFDCSAMDGYAVREPAGSTGFRCVDEAGAGDARELHLAPGECVRIFTGARVPAESHPRHHAGGSDPRRGSCPCATA